MDRSFVYRVAYTNTAGVKSYLCFSLAVEGDCEATTLTPSVTVDDVTRAGSEVTVLYGGSATLSVADACGGWGTYAWSNGQRGSSVTLSSIKENTSLTVTFTNQGGCVSAVTFHVNVHHMRPDIIVNGVTYTDIPTLVVKEGDNIVLAPHVPALLIGTCQWPDGSDGSTYSIDGITASGEYLFSYLHADTTYTYTYRLFVDEGKGTYRAPAAGRYLLRHRYTDTYLTAAGKDGAAHLSPLVTDGDKVAMHAGQVWLLEGRSQRYNFIGLPDSLYLNKEGLMKDIAMRPFRFRGAKGTDYLSIQNTGTSGNICWVVDAGGTINFAGSAEPKDYPFELIPYEEGMGMTPILPAELAETRYYSLSGARIDEPASGIFIRCRIWTDGTVVTDRILMK